jgi:hypothetical protein
MTLLEIIGFGAGLVMFAFTMIWLRLWLIDRTVEPNKPIQKQWRKTG